MTLDEFLERLRAHARANPRGWCFMDWSAAVNGGNVVADDRRSIRFAPGPLQECHCPVSAVTGDPRDYEEAAEAAVRKLGLSLPDAYRLVKTADGLRSWLSYDEVLRFRLLEAVGLQEAG